MSNTNTPLDAASRWEQLSGSMAGFDGLITMVQGTIVGHSLATGEVWHTSDVETTLVVAGRILADLVSMTEAFGMQA